jgi:glucose-6-phosphate 1-epimerase
MNHLEHIRYGQLPAIRINAADGAQAVVTLFGAHVVSWTPAGAKEQLFCSTRSALDGSKAIRGGIPVIFPQFGERGNGMRHGFARLSHWHLVRSGAEDGAGFAEFGLSSGDKLGAPWPHEFSLLLRVAVQADTLDLTFRVRNTGQTALAFSAALHTYHAVADIASAEVDGLQQLAYLDQTSPAQVEGEQTEHMLACTGVLDRIYSGVPGEIRLRDGARELLLSQEGFDDAVVWNPGPSASLSDMDDEDAQRFVCIEPALIAPYELPAGGEWLGRHRVRYCPTI